MRPFIAFIIALVWISPVQAVQAIQAPKPHPLVQKYCTLKLGKSWNAQNIQFAKGHAVFLLASGEVTEVLAGDRTVGVYFRGKGTLDYVSPDKPEHAALRYNLEKNSSLRAMEAGGDLNIVEPFTEAAFWLVGEVLPTPGPDVAPSNGVTATAWYFFATTFGINRSWRGAQSFAAHEIDSPGQPVFLADVKGAHGNLLYSHDPIWTALEELEIHTSFGEIALSSLPIGWERREPLSSLFALTHVDLDLKSASPEDATLVAVETYVPSRTCKAIWLSLISPAEGRQDQKFRFGATSVKDEQNRELLFDHREGRILIELKEPATAGKPIRLKFKIQGKFLYQPTLAQYWKLGVFPWFPQPDLAGQSYTVHATAQVRKPFIPVVPGTTVRRVTEGDYVIVETRIERPIQFFVIDAGRFDLSVNTENGRTVTVASYGGKRGNTEKLGRMAHQYIQLYELMLGPFPFKEFNIIHQLEYGYGQAPPGTMYITDEAFDSISSEANQGFSRGVTHRFAHEIAHQYWGIKLKMPSLEEQWLTESFAEYSSALAILRTKGFGEPTFNAMAVERRDQAKGAASFSTIPEANRLVYLNRPIDSRQARQALIYDKGALLLHVLHKDMGDQVFYAFLQALVRSFDGKFVTTIDVRDLAGIVGRKDYTAFFERYYWGTELP